MRLFGHSKDTEKLRRLQHILERSHAGIYKRIDENRELLQLLYKEAPVLLQDFPWIHRWIESQDEFLNKLADTGEIDKPFISEYPRPFPSQPDSAGVESPENKSPD